MNLSPTRGEGTPTPTPRSSPAPSTRLQDIAGNGIVIEPPTPVDNAAALSWDDAADVVVIGFGGAGAAAALQARESGASVLVVERFAGGGTTALSGGVFYAGGGTRIQVDAGVADSVDDLFDYLRQERKDAVSEATLRRFCAQSPETIDWLMRHGVPFEGSLYSDKTNYPPDGKYLYFSGNEKTPAFAAKAKPAPRGHRTVGTGLTGAVYFRALYAAVERSGIRVRTHSRAVRLITDAAATVIGIEILAITEPQHQRRHQALYAQLDPRLPFSNARAERAIARFCLGAGSRRHPTDSRPQWRDPCNRRLQLQRGHVGATDALSGAPQSRVHAPGHDRLQWRGHPTGRVGGRRDGRLRSGLSGPHDLTARCAGAGTDRQPRRHALHQ